MILFWKSPGLMKANLVEHPGEMVQPAFLLKGTPKDIDLQIVTSRYEWFDRTRFQFLLAALRERYPAFE